MANTRRENRLEELGRVDAEKAYTSKGKRNLRDEKHRIRRELKAGGMTKAAQKSANTFLERVGGGDRPVDRLAPHRSSVRVAHATNP